MKAIQVKQPGGPEALEFVDLPIPQPKSREAVVKIAASGVNFIDVNLREGRYKVPLPFVVGQEAAGVVSSVGSEVKLVKSGDRVAWSGILGSYAEYVAAPVEGLVPIPQNVSDQYAAAAMLQGMTAHYLCYDTYPLKSGETCLIHAAAGGVGLLLVQMAKMKGARVIGTAGSEEKALQAKAAGADEVVVYTKEDFVAKAKGVHVVYDSVGKSTFLPSLDCLRPRGMMVSFGNASGPVPDFAPLILSQKGSLFLTRPSLAHYTADRAELQWRAGDVLRWIAEGKLKLHIHKTYP